ncbi:M56 family metallopeptidase [Catellatospora methionotrophica]|uniref:M56 family metallopeptidase n=1 Tax=Catellatospora methionotrophica TaxID=121620 RepID=UPI0033DB92F6
MTIAAVLLLLATSLAWLAGRSLPRASWVYRCPRLGLAAWYTVVAVIVMSVVAAPVVMLATWQLTLNLVCAGWMWCAQILDAVTGAGHRVLALLALTAVTVVVARGTVTGVRGWRESGRRRREHTQMLSMVAYRDDHLGALVLEHPCPAAYALPGGGGQVVITTGALAHLPREQVDAVLEHERAHLHGSHHLLQQTTRMLAMCFPTVRVFAQAGRQVDRLVELCADDAVTGGKRALLARALVICAQAASGLPTPAGALGAHGGDAVERVHRLMAPPPALSRVQQSLVVAGLAVLLLLPPALVVLGLMYPAASRCLPAL